jgi:hypothetical protein
MKCTGAASGRKKMSPSELERGSGFAEFGLKQQSQRTQCFRGVGTLDRNLNPASVRADESHEIEYALPVHRDSTFGNMYVRPELASHFYDLRCYARVNSELIGDDEILLQGDGLSGFLTQVSIPLNKFDPPVS